MLLSMIVFFLCAVLFKRLGFLVVGMAFMISQICLCSVKVGRKDIAGIVLQSLGITIIAYLIFNYGFKLQIPKGILKF